MVKNPKGLAGLVHDLVEEERDVYFAFKVPGLDVFGMLVPGIRGTLREEGKDYVSIDSKTDGYVVVPRDQIAYIAREPLSSGSQTIPPELSTKLTTVQENIFRYLLRKGTGSNEELRGVSETTNEGHLKWHIMNLRKRLEGTPYEIYTIRGRGYGLRVNP